MLINLTPVKIFSKIFASIVLLCIIFAGITTGSFAQERGHKKSRVSPNASVSQTIGTTKILIPYGRPSLNGREIFGKLVPYGKVWRAGANEATAIVLPEDVTIEGKPLKAGTYSMYTVPHKEGPWTIIINSNLGWGIPYDKSKDILRVQVKAEEASFREQFMIYFENVTNHSADIVLHWANTKIPFTVEV